MSYRCIASMYFFCVFERGTINFFFDETGMVFKKKSFKEAEASKFFIMYLISSEFKM